MIHSGHAARRLAGAALVSFGLMATSASATPLDPFLVFGDSLSDAGFFGGQATDGDTWAAQLGATTSTPSPTYNFAQGGATAVSSGGSLPFGFAEQIGLFQTLAPPTTTDTWSVVWFGGNDLLGAADLILDPGSGIDLGTLPGQLAAFGIIDATVDAAVAAIVDGVTELHLTNMLSKFVVPGLPDLGSIPFFGGAPVVAALATQASQLFNADLALAVGELEKLYPITASFLDTAALFDAIVADSPGNGFTNVTGTCRGQPTCDGFVFWDPIHPTGATHTVLARAISAELTAAPVPLPAGWALLLSAGVALGALRRRLMRAA